MTSRTRTRRRGHGPIGARHEPPFRRSYPLDQHDSRMIKPPAASDAAGACRTTEKQRHRSVRTEPRCRCEYHRACWVPQVEVISLAQTSASLFADDYDATMTQRMSNGAGVPADYLGAGDRPGGAGPGCTADCAGVALFAAGNRTRQALLRKQIRSRSGGAGRFRRNRFEYVRQTRSGECARCIRRINRPEIQIRGTRRQFPDDGIRAAWSGSSASR